MPFEKFPKFAENIFLKYERLLLYVTNQRYISLPFTKKWAVENLFRHSVSNFMKKLPFVKTNFQTSYKALLSHLMDQ